MVGCRKLNVFVDDGVGTAFLKGLEGELVAVELVAAEGQEDAARWAVAAVGGDAGVLLVELVEFFDIHNRRFFNGCKVTHF